MYEFSICIVICNIYTRVCKLTMRIIVRNII